MTYFAKGKKMWRYPSHRTLVRLKSKGYNEIVWQNGDFITIWL